MAKKVVGTRPKPLEPVPMKNDDFIQLDNRVTSERIPEELVSEHVRIPIYVKDGKFEPKIVKSKNEGGGWEIELPLESSLVSAGQLLERVSVQEIQHGLSEKVDTEPNMPKWVDYTPHNKISSASMDMMYRINGKPIVPHYGVFGTDDRQVYYPSGYPWHCVGRVFVWNDASKPNWSWYGSAVLIGNRTILTAGHVVPWNSKNWAMKFVPAYYDGASLLGNQVSSWVTTARGYNTNNSVSAWDMAVCRLDQPLGRSYGYFGAKTYSSSWEGGNYWTLAGYPSAVSGGNRPSRIMWFPTVDDDTDGNATEVEYYADQTGGNSGGPVFGFWDGLPYVVGTVSGGEKTTFFWFTIEDVNVAAGGSAIVDLIRWARNNWT